MRVGSESRFECANNPGSCRYLSREIKAKEKQEASKDG
jgi:hypothetical protein